MEIQKESLKKYLCLDLGGTAIKYGVLNEAGEILTEGQLANPVRLQGVEEMLKAIYALVDKLRQEETGLAGMAVSTAGIVDSFAGKIVFAGETFPGYTGTPLAELLEKNCGLKTCVENDVNCAAMGEAWLGAGQAANPLAMLTIGTGVGGAILWDKRILQGAAFAAGEAGYLPQEGGTLEELASVTALLRYCREAGLVEAGLDGRRVIELAKAGNDVARQALQRLCRHLATGIVQLACVLNPAMVVIGGGLAEAAYLWPFLQAELEKQLPSHLQDLQVVPAKLGNKAGMVGALASFLAKQK